MENCETIDDNACSDKFGGGSCRRAGNDHVEGGALRDIFRRQDVPMLQEYLRKHFKQFRRSDCHPIQKVTYPVHDGTFYLTLEHKRKLKEEYGIEPWTFVQKLGGAVFIPAGCPHQVRNLKSCIKVAVEFVSPENVGECLRLTNAFRTLPENHSAKEDKLQVKKMTVHAISEVVKILDQKTSFSSVEWRNRFGKRLKQSRRKKEAQTINKQPEQLPVEGCSLRQCMEKGRKPEENKKEVEKRRKYKFLGSPLSENSIHSPLSENSHGELKTLEVSKKDEATGRNCNVFISTLLSPSQTMWC